MFRRTTKRELARQRYRLPRLRVDLSQVDTAAKARISQVRYWKIENGYATATKAEDARLAKVFRITPSEFSPATDSAVRA
jgi:transcriptional regulator with XRE-family HTH domain